MLAGSVSAQGMLDGSFTGNFPPKDWGLANAIGSKSWSVAWGGGADGGNHTTLYAQNAGTMNDAWIVSPQICPSAENYKLVFFTKKAAADTSDMTLSVYVSATGNSMADFTEPALLIFLLNRALNSVLFFRSISVSLRVILFNVRRKSLCLYEIVDLF